MSPNVEQLRAQLAELRKAEKASRAAIINAELALIIREWTRKVNGK